MDATLRALGNILLQALPTVFLVMFLYIYLQKVFFRPMGEALEARRKATEGVRMQAEEILRMIEKKTAAYEDALQSARAEIFLESERERQKAVAAHAARLKEARAAADQRVRQAREQIAADVEAAKQSLAAESPIIADMIVGMVLPKGAPVA
jgi:F0F1-type ATP synthase membrane subunit b/b'